MTALQDRRIPMPVWESLLKSCGLRRAELERLHVDDITQDEDGQIWLHIAESEESPEREVPVFNGFNWAIISILAGQFPSVEEPDAAQRRSRSHWKLITFQAAIKKRSPNELLISSVPPDLDFEQGRWEYAWWMYFGTIESLGVVHYPRTFNEVGEQVRLTLGLPKIDETIRGFMRQAKRDFMREFKAWV